MDQNNNSSNRFIFNDEYYNNFNNDNNTEKLNDTSTISTISIPKIEEVRDTPIINQTENNNTPTNENVPIDNSINERIQKMNILGIPIGSLNSNQSNPNKPDNLNQENTINDNVLKTEYIKPLDTNYQNNNSDTLNDSIPLTNNINNQDIVNNDFNFNISTPVEEKKEEINTNIVIPIEEVVTPKFEEKKDINLNVESGIDTNLEQQFFNSKKDYIQKPEIVSNFELNETPKERTIYRAVRRPKNDTINQINTNQGINITPVDSNNSINNQIENSSKNINQPIIETESWKMPERPAPIFINEKIDYSKPDLQEEEKNIVVTKSNLIEELKEKELNTGKVSILARYGDDFCSRDYITNPAIGRDKEIKELGIILLTPEKSAILVGKPGIGKTSIVEGLAYQIQRNNVPEALQGYTIVSVKTTSLLGSMANGETRLQTLIDELKELDKIILFVDEIHMLMGATNESSLDFANMFKESLGRGSIKMIGATTSDEYERYVLRDKAFVRRFQKVDVLEPTKEQTVEILMGTLPKIEKTVNARLKYTRFIQTEIMSFIVDITSEYKRIYGIGSRYPDICITLLNQAFSEARFNNKNEVDILDIRNAIAHSKNIYPDVIQKELINFDEKFKNLINEEK